MVGRPCALPLLHARALAGTTGVLRRSRAPLGLRSDLLEERHRLAEHRLLLVDGGFLGDNTRELLSVEGRSCGQRRTRGTHRAELCGRNR